MEILQKINFYIIPPLLSFIVGITLALISVVRGRFRLENILFAMVCIWYVLMGPIFISHHLLKGDFETIMFIERSIHCVYVFLPAIAFLYLYKAFEFKSKIVVILSFIISAVISGFVWTEYYFYGFYVYPWGYSAKGGIAFMIFGAYGIIATFFFIAYFIWKLRKSINAAERLKFKYIVLAFVSIALLTLLNVPAINGIDFYPYGNFMFIPLIILAYGILKHRLMDIRSILLASLMWAVLSSLVFIPNAIGFYFLYHLVISLPMPLVFLVQIGWFMVNLFYVRIIQPLIDQLFNRRKYDLRRIEAQFIENISMLRNREDLLKEFTESLKKALGLTMVDVYLRKDDSRIFANSEGVEYEAAENIEEWFLGANHLVEKGMIETDQYYSPVRDELVNVFSSLKSENIAPLIQNYQLIGLLSMSEKFNLKGFSNDELRFINEIRAAASISISNSSMFQNLSDLKDTLEAKVEERTEELQATMNELEAINETLAGTNRELEDAHLVAEMNMQMAVNVQESLFPKFPPRVENWDVAFVFKPMTGVSGDFYDFYVEDEKLKGMSLFDVSGHGIASGLITMIARSVIHRNFFSGKSNKLNEILEGTNSELVEELSNVDNFLTGVVLRFQKDIVEYVNAGHPDMLYKKYESGKVRPVVRENTDYKGSILGVMGVEQQFKVIKFKVDPNDTLFLSSDCIFESTNEQGEQYGEDRLIETFSRAPEGSAHRILDHIMNDFYSFTGNKDLGDDLTVIVVRRR